MLPARPKAKTFLDVIGKRDQALSWQSEKSCNRASTNRIHVELFGRVFEGFLKNIMGTKHFSHYLWIDGT